MQHNFFLRTVIDGYVYSDNLVVFSIVKFWYFTLANWCALENSFLSFWFHEFSSLVNLWVAFWVQNMLNWSGFVLQIWVNLPFKPTTSMRNYVRKVVLEFQTFFGWHVIANQSWLKFWKIFSNLKWQMQTYDEANLGRMFFLHSNEKKFLWT